MASRRPEEDEPDYVEPPLDLDVRRGRDGVEALRDVEAEAGDEEEVDDLYRIDEKEARQSGVGLDGGYDDEDRLD